MRLRAFVEVEHAGPGAYAGAITAVDCTRFDSVDYTDAPRALGLGGPVHRRDGPSSPGETFGFQPP